MLKAKFIKNPANSIFSCSLLLRLKHSTKGRNYLALQETTKENFHQSQAQDYVATKQLPLPLNIEDLNSSEKLKFSPQRSRDINGSFISSSSSTSSFVDLQSDETIPVDDRIECYDCSGTVNLSSAMQTNVPFPFTSKVKPVHLNMPGGQLRQEEKYIAEDLNNVHHANTRELNSAKGTSLSLGSGGRTKNFYFCFPSRDFNFPFGLWFSSSQFRTFCTAKKETETSQENVDSNKGTAQLTTKQKVQKFVKEYGPVFIVLHISISTTSLLIIYILVASGVDTSGITKVFGASEGAVTAETAAHIVVAYAVHKMLAPVRLGMSFAATPIVASKLRKLGLFKPRQTQQQQQQQK